MKDNNMIPEIERLVKAQNDVDLVEKVELVNGQSFDYQINSGENGRELGEMLTPPRPAVLTVKTLTGFLDAITAQVIGGNMPPKSADSNPVFPTARIVHVEDYLTVSVKTTTSDVYGVRDALLTAKHTPIDAFVFDQYYPDPARFIIGLQVAFLQTQELLSLIRIASNLKAGNTVHVEDDGFSQSVTLKAGEVSTAEVKIPPRIKLIPIRTFSEVAPAESEFLIRFKQTPDQTPAIALFNVDGTKWQSDTMLSIKNYLVNNLPAGTPIIA